MLNYFKQLFNSNEAGSPVADDLALAPTADLPPEDMSEGEITGNPTQFIAGSALDVGKQRENNEDALISICSTLAVDSENFAFGLFAVADGMGGHKSGELASESALRTLGDYVISKLYIPHLGSSPEFMEDTLHQIMQAGIGEAHKAVKRAAPGGGCTLTAALALGEQLIIAHIGDSRAYAIEAGGGIKTLTRDHTLVKLLEEQGQITSEEAEMHPQKSVLYRALGQGDTIEAEIFTRNFPESGYLLLCSDGLWGVVQEKDIEKIIRSATSPYQACQSLVKAANAAGGPDNIASLLVRLSA